jgi:succinate-semialdehyde dehydrogenase/glutarate-semialdehyde dehydrogenase
MSEHLLHIGGAWRHGGGGTIPAVSPSSGEPFATVAMADRGDVDAAVAAARAAWPAWAALSAFERAQWCSAVAAAIGRRSEDLARALTQDQGKPLVAEAYDEVSELAEYFTMAAEDAKRLAGEIPPSVSAGRRVLSTRVPLGVVGVISPWNWPYTMGAELFAPALAAGNAVVWVPAPTTTACCALLAEIIAAEDAPPGVFNFVPGPGPVAGDALAGHPGVNAVGFIGSVATGGSVASRAAGKTQLLELGGNGPMVVLEDADLGLAAEAALEAAYVCAGQSCTAGERFLVHSAVRAEFVDRVVAAAKDRIRLGDPFDPATTMGPLNNQPNADKFARHVGTAVAAGARSCYGGSIAEGFPTTLFAEPTVLDGVTLDMEVAREETFGPVVPVIEVNSAAEALELTNASPFGLTAAVFTGDLQRGLAFAEQARAGWVNINASTNLWESHLPFGGRSGSVSGRGRVGGRFAMEAFTEPKAAAPPAYLDMTVGRFLDALSATTPDPSGGGVAALAVALAAGLCVMTAGLSARQLPEAPRLAEQARRLRDRAAPLAQADAKAYRAVIAALRARDAAAPGKPRMAAALSQASVVPMEVAEIGAELAAVAAAIAAGGNPNVRGDAVTAALLAAAGSRSAAALVRINLAGAEDDDRPARAERLAAGAARLAASTERTIS